MGSFLEHLNFNQFVDVIASPDKEVVNGQKWRESLNLEKWFVS